MATATIAPIKAPFPYFGGKSRAASLVWERFGDVPNYVDPFAGSLAVLLSRPHPPRTETVNDLDGNIANFWRAVQADPEVVAKYADWPVNEIDIIARRKWCFEQTDELVTRMKSDMDYYDAKVAGIWCWGMCCSITNAWLDNSVHLGNAGRGVHRAASNTYLVEYFNEIAARLRRVRVRCSDWSGVCSASVTYSMQSKNNNMLTGVFLDPPYTSECDTSCYAHNETTVAHDVREWAIAQGENPVMRIALCGYEGEHAMPDDWECVAWKAQGGYSKRGTRGEANAARERMWFSPNCLKAAQGELF